MLKKKSKSLAFIACFHKEVWVIFFCLLVFWLLFIWLVFVRVHTHMQEPPNLVKTVILLLFLQQHYFPHGGREDKETETRNH